MTSARGELDVASRGAQDERQRAATRAWSAPTSGLPGRRGRVGKSLLAGLMLVVAGVAGGALALALDRHLRAEEATADVALATQEEPDAPAPAAPPPLPMDPGPARAIVVSALVAAEVPHGAIRHGRYPLRGPGRAADETIDLVTFACPVSVGCAPALARLEADAHEAGFALVGPAGGDDPGRPIVRALAQEARPALALRAFAPGPRLTVVLTGPGAPEAALALDADVTVAVDAGDPRAASRAATLVAAGREVVVDVGAGRATDAEGVRLMVGSALDAVPTAAGVVDAGAAGRAGDRSLVGAALEAVRARGRYFVDDAPAYRSVAQTGALTAGARYVGPGNVIDEAEPLQVDQRLKAVEAGLALEGEAVLVAQAHPAVVAALARWLPAARARGVHLLRASEVAR
jgi:polysaccharide deacetylase 2 family uncharacterized protein YibQ